MESYKFRQEHRVDTPIRISTSSEINPETKILPDSYSIPNLSEKTPAAGTEQRFTLEYQNHLYTIIIQFEDLPSGDNLDIVHITLEDSDQAEEVGGVHLRRVVAENGWEIFHRRVKEKYRGNNRRLGTLLFSLATEVARHYRDATKVEASNLFLYTDQPSVVRTIINQAWLKKYGLDDLAHSDGSNLGFTPSRPRDIEPTKKLLLASRNSTRQSNNDRRYDIFARLSRAI